MEDLITNPNPQDSTIVEPKVTNGFVTPAGMISSFEQLPTDKPIKAATILLQNISKLLDQIKFHQSLESKVHIQRSVEEFLFAARGIHAWLLKFRGQKRLQQTKMPQILELQRCIENVKLSVPDKELTEEEKQFDKLSDIIARVETNDLWGQGIRKPVVVTKTEIHSVRVHIPNKPEEPGYVRTLDWIQEQFHADVFHHMKVGETFNLKPRKETQNKIYFIEKPCVTRFNEVLVNTFLLKYEINDRPNYRLLDVGTYLNEFELSTQF